jgi:thymidylate synthase (FAD)
MTKLKVTYVDHMGHDKRVVDAARISFGNNDLEFSSKEDEKEFLRLLEAAEQEYRIQKVPKITDKDKKLIQYLAQNKHMSPFEHNVISVIVECPLSIRSQIHRHRTFSYNEISRRYTSKDIEFYYPSLYDVRSQSKSNRQASDGNLNHKEATEAIFIMEQAALVCLETYNKLLDMGVAREQARDSLPMRLMTHFYMTGNLRNWAHFVDLRTHKGAQSEVRFLAHEVRNIITSKYPVAGKCLLETTL